MIGLAVILAKAGIHGALAGDYRRHCQIRFAWIPACAGMTIWKQEHDHDQKDEDIMTPRPTTS